MKAGQCIEMIFKNSEEANKRLIIDSLLCSQLKSLLKNLSSFYYYFAFKIKSNNALVYFIYINSERQNLSYTIYKILTISKLNFYHLRRKPKIFDNSYKHFVNFFQF